MLIVTISYNTQNSLTSRENEIRLGSCGNPSGESLWLAAVYKKDGYDQVNAERERKKPIKTSKATDLTKTTFETTEMTTDMTTDWTTDVSSNETNITEITEPLSNIETTSPLTTVAVTPAPDKTNAVFVSQKHLLLTSSWFLEYRDKEASWYWKYNKTRIDDSFCKKDNKASFRAPSVYNYVMDYHNDWRKVKEIIFLRFCEFRKDPRGFLAMVVVEKSGFPVPIICFPKALDKNQNSRMDFFKQTGTEIAEKVGDTIKCDAGGIAHFYSLGTECSSKRRGAPMVIVDSFRIQRLVGVVAKENKEEHPYYHIVQEYMNEMCTLMGLCRRETEQIVHVPGENDENIRNIIDDDYAEQVEEPLPLEYNGQAEQNMVLGIFSFIFMFSDLEVPKEIVNHIEIFRGDCENGWQCEPPLRAQKAVILNFCDQDDQFDRMFRIMLIEVKEFETSSFACISNDTTKLQMKELVNTYGFDDERLVYRLLEVTNIGKGYILTSKYYVYGDRGGPMVVDRNERGTIVGIGASTGWSDNSGNTWFFELSHHFENICNVTGICEGNPVNTTMDPANIKTTEMESTVYFKRK
ncbi:Protein CBG12539 [Caenorhabditis briggsae]|uniref:Protein CBG12539 n=1 Tax=Caenorhabditis briggsae TaxID=6238 RepID=A8XG02_CAEBR|nr:Protein CBG12539 [Caenorhabditis briggsae]CAP31507.2 Protein CBG12539 [Caenorhabditis briggsae]